MHGSKRTWLKCIHLYCWRVFASAEPCWEFPSNILIIIIQHFSTLCIFSRWHDDAMKMNSSRRHDRPEMRKKKGSSWRLAEMIFNLREKNMQHQSLSVGRWPISDCSTHRRTQINSNAIHKSTLLQRMTDDKCRSDEDGIFFSGAFSARKKDECPGKWK